MCKVGFTCGFQWSTIVNVSVIKCALKHVQELEEIACLGIITTTLLFIIQRTDISCFQPSNLDLIYKKAIQKAWLNGVQIKCIAIQWDIDGKGILFRNDLPIQLFEYYGPFLIE